MPKTPRPWIVTQHGPIEQIDDNLWGVESLVPGVPMPRRMCIAKRSDGKLVFFHAVPLEELPADPAVQVESMPGTKHGDALMVVKSGGGQRVSLCFTDAVMNLASGPLPMRLLRFTGGPKCPPVFKLVFVKDKPALRARLERLAGEPGLARLVPCHGEVIAQGAAQVLGRIAASV